MSRHILIAICTSVLMACFGTTLWSQSDPAHTPWPFHRARAASPSTCTKTVNAGDDLQAMLNSRLPGDYVCLAAGATFVGNYILPPTKGSGWITVGAAPDNPSLPPAGQRMDPARAGGLPKIVTPNADPALATADFSAQWYLVGIEFGISPGVFVYNLILLGSWLVPTAEQLATGIVLDRLYVHGNADHDGPRRCICLNSRDTTVINSYVSECKDENGESQAIAGWNGPGPFKIDNNYLEAASINLMFGGSTPSVLGTIPSDIQITHNRFYKPSKWNLHDPSYAGKLYLVKNHLEFKNAQRVLIDGNVFENTWWQGQGSSLVLNGVGGPATVIENITYTNNIVRTAPAAVTITADANGKQLRSTNSILLRTTSLRTSRRTLSDLPADLQCHRGSQHHFPETLSLKLRI